VRTATRKRSDKSNEKKQAGTATKKSNDNKRATKENNDKMQREEQRKARMANTKNKASFLFLRVVNSIK